ncbi:MAG: hypothetical protein QOD66_620 [Solirubrobacteraceae bacterium]|jgi:hypothetical protein|nr:hypothetical protein [Solirubrobacteraceae bacterium]
MADKEITVAVPEERVPEFYSWFAAFLTAEPGTPPPLARHERRGPRGSRHHGPAQAWSADDADQAAWLYGRLAPPARELLDVLIDSPGERFAGEDLAKRLQLQKGAHGVAGILAWPGRYSRHLDRTLPITTEGRADGGTDYYMDPELAALFAAARNQPHSGRRGRRSR